MGIEEALMQEREPELVSSDTSAWRDADGQKPTKQTPLAAAVAKEFDLNWRGVRNFVYYSLLLVIFSAFGTNTRTASSFLLAMIPCLWVTKLRQLRFIMHF